MTRDWILYPYFWARRSEWKRLALVEHADPQFREFMSAGAARVQIPVRPGFEESVEHYMQTGEVFLGGGLPVMGDPDFISFIADKLEQLGAPDASRQPWPAPPLEPLKWEISRPTDLVVLRGASDGLPSWSPAGEEL